MDQTAALLVLFVLLPVALAVAIAALVQRRSGPVPTTLLTSNILRDGTPARAVIVDWRAAGQSFLDLRPMVTFKVSVIEEPPFEMAITQSVPRQLLRALERGMEVDIRLTPDRANGAIAFGGERDDGRSGPPPA